MRSEDRGFGELRSLRKNAAAPDSVVLKHAHVSRAALEQFSALRK